MCIRDREKAIHGLLYADGSYERFPVYYLSREWEYYPDALLTPEDDLDKYYFRYISIGEYGGMELGNSERSPYGSGTYRLKIMLPAEQHTYGSVSYTHLDVYKRQEQAKEILLNQYL